MCTTQSQRNKRLYFSKLAFLLPIVYQLSNLEKKEERSGYSRYLSFALLALEDLITLACAIAYLQNVRRQSKLSATSAQCYASPQLSLWLAVSIQLEQKLGGKHHCPSTTQRRKGTDHTYYSQKSITFHSPPLSWFLLFRILLCTPFILKIPPHLAVCFTKRDNWWLLEWHSLCLIFIFTVIQNSRVIYFSTLTIWEVLNFKNCFASSASVPI